MKIVLVLASIVLAAAGCRGKSTDDKPSPAPAPKVVASCSQQTAELKTWLEGLYSGKDVAKPWPTGDAAFDAELDKWRARVREASKPVDPSQRVEPLSPSKPGLLDHELAGCQAATAQVAKVGDAAPGEQAAAWIGLADAIGACDCKPNIAHVKALLYGMHRGPD